jgi:hypothetical protein
VGVTFVVFPLFGLILGVLSPALITPALYGGILFICVLPSTVQSSIAFTSIAGGNVPAAIGAATLSNILGMFLTPLLVTVLISGRGQGFSFDIVSTILLQLLAPFILGQILQPWIAGAIARHKKVLTLLDRGAIAPLGLSEEMVLRITPEVTPRCADMCARDAESKLAPLALENSVAYRSAGRPGGGVHATARAFAAFYQMLMQGGRLGETRLFSPRMISYVLRNFTGERINLMNGRPGHRALGPTVRGETDFHPGHGTIAHPRTVGHAGMGTSYVWGDPDSGVSFAFMSNGRLDDDAHDRRMELLCNVVHASIIA